MSEIWQRIGDDKPLHTGFRKVVERRFRLPAGNEVAIEAELIPNGVGIAAFTPEGDMVFCSQYKPGPLKVLYETPGGIIDEGEERDAAAARELREETGYESSNLRYIGYVPYDGYSEGGRYYYIATGCKKVGEQKLDAGESMEVVILPVSEVMEHMRAGSMTLVNGYTMFAAFDYIRQHLDDFPGLNLP